MTEAVSAELDLEGLDDFLSCSGHALVLGGPGSGKTTAALVKANCEIQLPDWQSHQQVLFLSFARSTIARVSEAAGGLIERSMRKCVDLTTYHSFVWRLIRSHGYLIQNDPPIRLLPPHDAAVRLTDATKNTARRQIAKTRDKEKHRLLEEEGLLDFDLFAGLAADLLEGSSRLCRIVSRRFPLIFLDEFQDTNSEEYRFIKCFARESRIIALADPEQRIYEFRGADPKRIQDFIKDIAPAPFDLAQRNHRSNGTDILDFANHLLTQETSDYDYDYDDVDVRTFPLRRGPVQHLWMKTGVIAAINRVKASPTWSVAVLVPTKNLMLTVSDYLSARQDIDATRKLPAIGHQVAVDAEGPTLAGVVIGRLMECTSDRTEDACRRLVEDLCCHITGRKSNRGPSQAEIKLVDGIRPFVTDNKVRGPKRQRIVKDCQRIVQDVLSSDFTGDPYSDWISVREIIAASSEPELQCVASDAQYLRFLRKGASLRLKLSSLWQNQQSYAGASQAVQNAFVQEHFLATSQEPRGVHVMTIHKSKGKEFDEVLIYEGTFSDRIVRRPDEDSSVAQARLALRVAVSRAKRRVTIVTPANKPCELLCDAVSVD